MSLTHHKGLSLTPDPRGGTALQVTGTTAFTGNPAITGDTTVTGDLTVSGAGNLFTTNAMTVTNTALFNGKIRVASAANGICGIKTIAAGSAGVGVISSTKIVATSRIFVTPQAAKTYTFCGVRAVGTGTASIYLNQFNATGATLSGKVAWMVVNL